MKNINSNKKQYSPYRYNDYLEMRQNYQQSYKRLGGLGPNIGNEDWLEKQKKFEKMNDYIK